VVEAVERARGPNAGNAGAPPPAETPIESQLKRLLRCSSGRKAPGPSRQKIVVAGAEPAVAGEPGGDCFAAIDEGVIRIVDSDAGGPVKMPKRSKSCWNSSTPAHFWRAHRGFVVNIDPHSRSGAVVQGPSLPVCA